MPDDLIPTGTLIAPTGFFGEGPPGPEGPPGTEGPQGNPSWAQVGAEFTVPEIDQTVTVTVDNTAWMDIGAPVRANGIVYVIESIESDTSVTLRRTSALDDGGGLSQPKIGARVTIPQNGTLPAGLWLVEGYFSESGGFNHPGNITTGMIVSNGTFVSMFQTGSAWPVTFERAPITNGGGSPAINYSEEEQDTGQKWVDGSPIYQKSLFVSSFDPLPHGVDIGILVSVNGYYTANNEWFPIFTPQFIRVTQSVIENIQGYPGYITIQYTKSQS